jgi:ferredoxin
MAVRVVVDFDTCESHGACVEAAPEVFELRDLALYVLDDQPAAALRPKLDEAARLCPTESIFIVEDA